jgi:3-deoxy-D-manno-octulosonic-acid transferase
VVNGRLSERSFKGYRRVRGVLRRTFGRLRFAAVQDGAYRERFIAMGVPAERCTVTGSMKWDSASIAESVPGSGELSEALGIDRSRPLVVGGSTAEDEEGLLHAACLAVGPEVQLLCAPRKPEHFDAAAAGLPGCVRRSKGERGSATGRFLLDTIGELRKAYALADVVVMGRSFGTLYGSDPIEPGALGKPVLIGPAYKDFDTIVRTMRDAGALTVTGRERLAEDLRGLVRDASARSAAGARAVACVRANMGASRRHADLLLALLQPSSSPS